MPKYFFILGQNKNLSIGELANKLNLPLGHPKPQLAGEAFLLEIEEPIKPEKLLKELGGTVKIGEIISEINDLGEININQLIGLMFFKEGKKVYFGFSFYGDWDSKFLHQFQRLAMLLKKELKEKKISSRWVISRDLQLSSVVVKKNNLLTKGAEIVFIKSAKTIFYGRTLAVQEFADYSFRDYSRPARDQTAGMLPPKLAKIMINLAATTKSAKILDPFCGSGTILSEALLLGYKDLIGSDINLKAISDSQANLKWLGNHYSLGEARWKLFNLDVRNLSSKIELDSIDAIISEPYLGPIKSLRSEEEAKKVIKELSGLYLGAFGEFKKVLKSDGKIVIIFPVLKIKTKLYELPILTEIRKIGFRIVDFLPNNWSTNLIQTTSRGSLIYSRPDQRVLREIFIFKNDPCQK